MNIRDYRDPKLEELRLKMEQFAEEIDDLDLLRVKCVAISLREIMLYKQIVVDDTCYEFSMHEGFNLDFYHFLMGDFLNHLSIELRKYAQKESTCYKCKSKIILKSSSIDSLEIDLLLAMNALSYIDNTMIKNMTMKDWERIAKQALIYLAYECDLCDGPASKEIPDKTLFMKGTGSIIQ